jgi:hypothetical protein
VNDVPQPCTVELALVSHTNAGKTSLARTLLGTDVGEVRDAPHVTDIAEVHVLLRSACGDELKLWDTPGFGDSVRLVRRLQRSDNPIGWLLREVWDRFRDRPFWCSQQAVRTVRESADVVLYLANAAESPRDAGYLRAESQILQWLGKPVLVLLNQVGPPRPRNEEQAEVEAWRAEFSALGILCDVLPLDAFARCWVQEGTLLAAVGRRVEPAQAAALERLHQQWTTESVGRFAACMRALAGQLTAAARDRESIDERAESVGARVMVRLGLKPAEGREQAMAALAARVDAGVRAATSQMIALNALEGDATETILRRVQERYASQDPIPEGRAALLGGILTGALTGLKADLAAGGLTMGAGALIGGVLGGLGGAGVARGLNRLTGVERTSLYWPEEFLDGLLRAGVLRYLAIAHYGRGRGRYVDSEAPAYWYEAVESQLAARIEAVHAIWKAARIDDGAGATQRAIERELQVLTAAVLARLYPDDVSAALAAQMRSPGDGAAAQGEPPPIPA